MSVEIVLHALAAGVGEALTRARRSQELPTQSREEVLTDLLAAPTKARDPIVLRARALGLPIDGWHVAVRLDFERLTDPQPWPGAGRLPGAGPFRRLGAAGRARRWGNVAPGTDR